MNSAATVDYRALLELRTALRRFLRWSEQQAHSAGVTPAQHQLMLAIRGHDGARGPTIGEVAEYLLLRHHSAVELADRAVTAGYVVRRSDPDNHRAVRLGLTGEGERILASLAARHARELSRLQPAIAALSEA